MVATNGCYSGLLNLIGWAFRDIGNTDKALSCYDNSLRIVPFHNAAVWHVSILAFEKAKTMGIV